MNVREIEVFDASVTGAAPADIEYLAAHTTIAEGQTAVMGAVMGVRLRKPSFQLFQWEVSRDAKQTSSRVSTEISTAAQSRTESSRRFTPSRSH